MIATMFFTGLFLTLGVTVDKDQSSKADRSCTNFMYDPLHNGHNTLVDNDSGTVMVDYTVQKAKEENQKLHSMAYRWMEYKNITSGKAKDYRSVWLPVDQTTGKPYKLTKLHSVLQTADRVYRMDYLDIPSRETTYGLLFTNGSRYLSENEGKQYVYCGPGYKNF